MRSTLEENETGDGGKMTAWLFLLAAAACAEPLSTPRTRHWRGARTFDDRAPTHFVGSPLLDIGLFHGAPQHCLQPLSSSAASDPLKVVFHRRGETRIEICMAAPAAACGSSRRARENAYKFQFSSRLADGKSPLRTPYTTLSRLRSPFEDSSAPPTALVETAEAVVSPPARKRLAIDYFLAQETNKRYKILSMSAWRPPRTSESSGASNRPSHSNTRLQPATKLHSLLAAHPLVSSYSLYSLLAHRRRWDKCLSGAKIGK
ncbi:hypothetical protein MSG28_012520 [Choristoneura fumiferana]|uniref:Uncharacterized protein n=1 Tax=Choristoneura fumiferana TaxID=7141 RepID=A0ACC0KDA1_CHOFU|nr:hypothetical protein MSG28_012520 [Choristoneura fumiferana]